MFTSLPSRHAHGLTQSLAKRFGYRLLLLAPGWWFWACCWVLVLPFGPLLVWALHWTSAHHSPPTWSPAAVNLAVVFCSIPFCICMCCSCAVTCRRSTAPQRAYYHRRPQPCACLMTPLPTDMLDRLPHPLCLPPILTLPPPCCLLPLLGSFVAMLVSVCLAVLLFFCCFITSLFL